MYSPIHSFETTVKCETSQRNSLIDSLKTKTKTQRDSSEQNQYIVATVVYSANDLLHKKISYLYRPLEWTLAYNNSFNSNPVK